MKFKKSQAGLEFVLLISFVMFVFIMVFSSISNNISDASTEQQKSNIKEIADRIETEIFTASSVIDGYSRIFILPSKAGNYNYILKTNPYNPIIGVGNSNNSELVVYYDQQYLDQNYTFVKFFYGINIDINSPNTCFQINKTLGVINVGPIICPIN